MSLPKGRGTKGDAASIFQKTYEDYVARLSGMDFRSVAGPLGGGMAGESIELPVFGETYTVSTSGIADGKGDRAPLDVCVILAQYLLRCPPLPPQGKEWAAYRDLKDSGPLTVYFRHDVEEAIAAHFQGRLDHLKAACESVGGYAPSMETSHDLAVQFDALPRVPVLLLFNDVDDEFPARATVLFERGSETYLDAESLAIAGRLLFTRLRRAGMSPI